MQNIIHLVWTGNAGWIVNHQDTVIAFDLDLDNIERKIPCALDVKMIAEQLKICFITHDHEDHFNRETCKKLLNTSNCLFVIPKSCEMKAKVIGIPFYRMRVVEPGERFVVKDVEVECVRAIHGHIGQSVYKGANMYDCGYRFKLGGKVFYQPGDTLPLEEHMTMEPVDVLFVSPTEHNTYIEGSMRMIRHLRPRYILPQHHSTYFEEPDNLFWSHGYVQEVYEGLEAVYQERYHVLQQDEAFTIL